ncbi:hypothetical protein WP8W19C02_P10270 (plasmid) [Enterobacter cloacae]|nr:hypothetical protein WP8W19C02_P10270 [Enterobacter cloacae]
MPRRYEIDAAWRAAITREQDGRQTVTTAAFVQHLHKFNWHWTPRRSGPVDRNVCDGLHIF